MMGANMSVREGDPGPAAPEEQRVVPIRLPVEAGSDGREWIVCEAPRSMLVPRMLAATGLAGYEPDTIACFLAALELAGEGAVWDVGANIGVYGLIAKALGDREVRGFEAVPDLAAAASATAVGNGLDYPIDAVALGAEPGEAVFYLSDRSDTSNSLAEGFRPSSRSLTVPVDTVDEIVKRTGEYPAVLKIDTETTEPDVLRGAAVTIAEHRPWILCEVLTRPYCGPALMEVIESWGYQWFLIKGEFPLAPTDEIEGDAEAMMWLLAPEAPSPEFWAAARRWRERLDECGPVGPQQELKAVRAELKAERRKTRQVRAKLSALKSSATMQAGGIVADMARRPLRGTLAAPGKALKLWRSRRRS
jgi:FkbM family methyltransferase